MNNDWAYMQYCEKLGRAAAEKGNAAVGALVVKDGEIISESEEAGKSKNDVTCHAEIEAIRVAINRLGTRDLSECILFTTHEPCVMCAYVIRFHKIKKVVFQHTVDYLGSMSSSMPLLISADVPPHWGKPPDIVHLG